MTLYVYIVVQQLPPSISRIFSSSQIETLYPLNNERKSKCLLLSPVRLFAIPRTIARQAPLSMEFSRQEYWSGLPFPSPGDLSHLGIEPGSPTLQADSLPSETPGHESLNNNSSLIFSSPHPLVEDVFGIHHCLNGRDLASSRILEISQELSRCSQWPFPRTGTFDNWVCSEKRRNTLGRTWKQYHYFSN